ncbi:MAG TPA: hypothetical protein VGB20_07270 [bacterium]
MRAGWVTAGLAACVAVAGSAVAQDTAPAPAGKEQEWIERFLDSHCRVVERAGNGARIVTDGMAGVWEEREGLQDWRTEFVLQVGDAFMSQPDHHAGQRFVLTEIRRDGIVVAYESWFDHRAFGGPGVTIDRGTARVGYRGSPVPGAVLRR